MEKENFSEQIEQLIEESSEYDLYTKFFLTLSDNAGPNFEKFSGEESRDNAICLSRRNKIARLLMPKIYAATRAGDVKAARKATKRMALYNEAYSLVLKRKETRDVYNQLLEFRKEYDLLEEYATSHNFLALANCLRTSNRIYREFVRLEFPYPLHKEAKQAAALAYRLGNPKKNVVFLVDRGGRLSDDDMIIVRDTLLSVVVESGAVFRWDKFSLMAYSNDVISYQSLRARGTDTDAIAEVFHNLDFPVGGSAFYDGICAAFDELETASKWETRWVFCIATGKDNQSVLQLEHVLQQLEQEGFSVFVIIVALDVASDNLADFAKICETARLKPNGKGVLLCAQLSNLENICMKAARHLGQRSVTLRETIT